MVNLFKQCKETGILPTKKRFKNKAKAREEIKTFLNKKLPYIPILRELADNIGYGGHTLFY